MPNTGLSSARPKASPPKSTTAKIAWTTVGFILMNAGLSRASVRPPNSVTMPAVISGSLGTVCWMPSDRPSTRTVATISAGGRGHQPLDQVGGEEHRQWAVVDGRPQPGGGALFAQLEASLADGAVAAADSSVSRSSRVAAISSSSQSRKARTRFSFSFALGATIQ